MARKPSRTAVGGVSLIVLCFFASATLRVEDYGSALADDLPALASFEPDLPVAGCAPAADTEALLATIREREAELDREAARLDDRAQELKVAEARLADQLAAFEEAQRELEETLALADEAAEEDIARMTTVYENMKPDEAARIFERMDVAFAAGLLARMRPDLAAEVLTGMEADAAYAVTVTIASRNAGVPTE